MSPPRAYILSLCRLALLVFGMLALVIGPRLGEVVAQAPPLDAAVLAKVKAATVHLQVKLADDRVVQGSGFFTDEPGLIATNAHVLDMLDPDGRKPQRVDVTVTDRTGKSRTLPAEVLGVDRTSDLALLGVEEKDLPAPLSVTTTSTVRETEPVYVFGYPLARDLGKEIAVSRAMVSSFRKAPNGSLHRIQLEGGVNPGNSGGPVVDAKGNVIGVAVGGFRNTQIGFAIPGQHVVSFLNGRLSKAHVGTAYKEGGDLKLPVIFEVMDPLGRLKKLEFDLWTGNPGPPRPNGAAEPALIPGDSAPKRYSVKLDKTAMISMDVPAPALADPKQVYWLRPVVTNGLNETRSLTATPSMAWPAVERKPVTLTYRPAAGKRTAEMVSLGSFRIRDRDGEETSLSLDVRTSFTEQFAPLDRKVFSFQLGYDRLAWTVKLNDKPPPREAEMRKKLADIILATAQVEMGADGSLLSAKADPAKVPAESRDAISDVSNQVLQSLELLCVPLPAKQLAALETWKAQRNVTIGSGTVAVPTQAEIEYKYLGLRNQDGKGIAVLALEGRVKGRQAGGSNVGGSLQGTALVSLETGEVLQANATVKADMDIVLEKRPAKATGTFIVSLRRAALAAGQK